MEVKNLSWDSTTARSNHKLLPKNVRGLIVGKSDCGKTTLLLNLLLNPGWLDYDKLFAFSKSLFQPEYVVLRKAMECKLPKEAILLLFNNQRAIQVSGLTISEFIKCVAEPGLARQTSGGVGPTTTLILLESSPASWRRSHRKSIAGLFVIHKCKWP